MKKAFMPIFIAAFQIVAAAYAIGIPDFAAISDVINTGFPSPAGIYGILKAIAWILVLSTTIWAAFMISGEIIDQLTQQRRRQIWATSVMAMGLLVFAAGAAHHLHSTPFHMQGGSIQLAEAALGD